MIVAAIAWREVRRAWSSGGLWLPVGFFLLVATLFPFAIGPDAAVLARVGGGVVWAAALLAALLPVERLVAPDLDNGTLDQLAVRGLPMPLVAASKLAGHWLGFAPPLMLASVAAAGLLGLSGDALWRIELGLLIGTPGLAALAVATGALVAGLRGGGSIAGLVMLPLAIPIVIFGAGALSDGAGAALKLLGAVSLLLVAGSPFVAGAAIRIAQD
ncbi:cytochrome C biogenesis protein CcmB [Sphingomonas sp. Leaf33]|uniref:heme exporter protein CcmB n=1 Tax=Sphingomonas sp. Leaf33 TaxID=1736215 RepID=UPI0006F9FC4D|nr:heme exporter protein CcmB [Sphingomonas sp. Leaf33]KQN24967.1 cytochrome C biogenesis protein CcmB [Sphingomonas sp. Leaf33]